MSPWRKLGLFHLSYLLARQGAGWPIGSIVSLAALVFELPTGRVILEPTAAPFAHSEAVQAVTCHYAAS
jgi:hypothetical protein